MGITAQYGPDDYADKIQTSIRGRRLGLDTNEFLVGHTGTRHNYELWTAGSTATSTSSTAQLSAQGISMLQTSTASTFYMPAAAAAYVGTEKTIHMISTAGGNNEVNLQSGYFQTSISATCTKVTFTPVATALYGGVTFQCIQTASTTYRWALLGSTGAAGSGSTHIAFS